MIDENNSYAEAPLDNETRKKRNINIEKYNAPPVIRCAMDINRLSLNLYIDKCGDSGLFINITIML
jgi:hypothetical protein